MHNMASHRVKGLVHNYFFTLMLTSLSYLFVTCNCIMYYGFFYRLRLNTYIYMGLRLLLVKYCKMLFLYRLCLNIWDCVCYL